MTICRVLGVPIRVHWLWVLVMALLVAAGEGWPALVAAGAVLAHELSHVAVARSLGHEVGPVYLTPYGGRASIPGLAAGDAAHEALVALVGPAASLLLALVGHVLSETLGASQPLLSFFVAVNAGLGLLNLVPAEPLDGSRLWRALRAGRVGYRRAADEVRHAGLAASLAAAVVGLVAAALGHFIWQCLALAILLAWPLRDPDRGAVWPVRDLAVRAAVFRTRRVWGVADYAAREDAAVREVLREMRPLRLHRIAVLSVEQVYLGTLWERDILEALEEQGPGTRVGQLIRRQN